VGFFVDARSFASNLVAESVGLAAGLVLAVIVAEHLIDSARRKRWSKVRDLLLQSIVDHLAGTSHMALEWVDPTDEEYEQLQAADLATTLRIIGLNYRSRAPKIPDEMEVLRQEHLRDPSQGETIWDSGEDWNSAEPILACAREDIAALESLTLQVNELGDERLSELMIALSHAGQVWGDIVRRSREESDGGGREPFDQKELTWWSAGSFYLAAAALAEYIGGDPARDSRLVAEVRAYVREHEAEGGSISMIWGFDDENLYGR
jgi:hypothetical protein